MFRKFLKTHYQRPMHHITLDVIRDYHIDLIVKQKISLSYQNQSINAIKFYMVQMLSLQRSTIAIDGLRKANRLPSVLTQEEVFDLINAIKNLKHRTVITLIYSTVLRISEVINLKITDIDSSNIRILIRYGKGQKERIIILSPMLLDFAEMECGQYVEKWSSIHMFPEQTAQTALDIRAKQIMPILWGLINWHRTRGQNW